VTGEDKGKTEDPLPQMTLKTQIAQMSPLGLEVQRIIGPVVV